MESLERRLDAVFSEAETASGPGFVVGIARPGVPDYRRAAGLSSVESACKNTERTRMRVGSTTKQFTSFAVLLLAEDGLLSIDDDIRKHLPELPEYPRPVLIRQLMSNSSGLRCYLDLIGVLAGFDRAVSSDRARQLQLHQRSVNFSAGERLIYCNGGYLLLSMLIERVAKMPLGEFFSKRIFEPLGMTSTSLETDDTKLLPGSATLHQRHSDGSYYRGTIGIPICGDGAIVSTVEDLLRWLTHMDAPVIGNARTWETMLNAGTEKDHGYGFGLMHGTYRGVKIIEHGGTVFGGRCQALRVPDYGISIAIMSNASDVFPSELAQRALDVLLEERLGPPLVATSAKKASPYAGRFYSSETGDVLRIIMKDDRAYVAGESGEMPLYDTADGGYRTNVASLSIAIRGIEANGDSPVRAIELREGGHRAVLQRVEQSGETGAIEPRYGTYRNEDCEATATIEDGEVPRLLLRSPYGSANYAMEHIAGDAWHARLENSWFPLTLLVEFGPRGFRITSGRTKRLEFTSSVSS